MKRTKGSRKERCAFTLVELLVVVAIIALLAAILLPALGRAQELANQVVCGSNLKAIGTGIRMYQGDNRNAPPWLNSFGNTTSWPEKTGTNAKSISTPGLVSPSALMFLLVRTGHSVDLFRCPSDDSVGKMAKIKFTHTDGESYYYWDFYDTVVDDEADGVANSRKVSYSYQNPISLYPHISEGYYLWKSGYTKSSRAGLAVMADKTPDYDTPSFYEFDWAVDPMDDEYRRSGMSQNHDYGDFINVLYADSHVKGSNRADVGIDSDNIYTTSYTLPTSQGGKAHPYNHRSEDDSYLVGPVK